MIKEHENGNNVYRVTSHDLVTILIEPNTLMYTKGDRTVIASDRPKLISDNKISDHLMAIPKQEIPDPLRERDFRDQFLKVNPGIDGNILKRLIQVSMKFKDV